MNNPRETAYDELISPLMCRIIAVCKEHEIPLVAQFALDDQDDGNGPLRCTTVLLNDKWDPPAEMKKAAHLLHRGEPSFLAVTITTDTKPPEGGREGA